MNLTQRDQAFIDLLGQRLGAKLTLSVDEVERDFGRAGVRRPGGENRVALYVICLLYTSDAADDDYTV